MITFFTTVRPFIGEFDALQRQAIASWRSAVPEGEVLLFGDREGVDRAAQDLGARYVAGIATTEHGTERFDAAFVAAEELANHDWLCEISADIVVGGEIRFVLRSIQGVHRPLVIGQRWDLDPGADPDTAVLHAPVGIDYFLYRRGTLGEIPPFAVGRTGYDNWMVWAGIERWGLSVIDATADLTAIHVNHGYPDWENGKQGLFEDAERDENHRLARETGLTRWYTIHDAPFTLINGKVTRRHG